MPTAVACPSAASRQAQTQIYVRVSREEMFIEPAELAEERPANHQARAGESGDFACADETAGVTVHADRETPHGVIGRSAHAQRHAGMLDGAICIDEQGAGRADVRL